MDTSSGNPYESPHEAARIGPVARPVQPPYAWSAILTFVACCYLNLLNGQVFTNAIVFLALLAISGLLWTRYVVLSRRTAKNRVGSLVLLLHLVIIIVFAAELPARHRFQQKFNRNVETWRQRARQHSRGI
jgi:drug/metabolite transporter (DMT)-like permease